jgi:hypothetical protein
MKQFLLAVVLVAFPVVAFAGFQMYLSPAPSPVAASLGDLSNLKAIVGDVQSIAKTGDLVAAEKRITDFESAWDQAEPGMRPKNPSAWGTVDDAADAAIHALRAQAPDGGRVTETLSALIAVLDNPSGTAAAAGKSEMISGIAVTDASGHAIACEEMIDALRAAIAGGKIAQADMAAADDFESKATERCNADDDMRADEFSAQGLALAGH